MPVLDESAVSNIEIPTSLSFIEEMDLNSIFLEKFTFFFSFFLSCNVSFCI